jgi:hypothetical protein
MSRAVNTSRTWTDCWEEAMVSGNGRQGVLCYGSPAQIRLTLSHERLFLPTYAPLDPPETARIRQELRTLLSVGRYRAAAERAHAFAATEDPGYAQTRPSDPFVGAATLTFTPNGPAGERGYRRTVDFATGVVTQRWGTAMVEVFVSRPADAVVVRLTGLPGGQWRLGPIDGTPPRPVGFTVDGLRLTAAGLYTVQARLAAGGTLVLARTTVGVPSPGPDLADLPADFDALLTEHAAGHGNLLGRVHLDLHGAPDRRAAQTEDLLAGPVDAALVERLFDAGRYAIISSTGDLPPNLQGVWSGTYEPAWSGDYTLDGNLQAAVAALHATGTPELMLPVFDLLDGWLDDFRRNARRLYGARGILVPAHCATRGLHNHFGPVWCLTFWTAGAAWLARLYFDHWCFTGDRTFLTERALPFMREAAGFYRDFINGGPGSPAGRHRPEEAAVFVPSYSPENRPANSESQAAVNATMDVAAVADLLRNLLSVAADDPDAPGWRLMLDRLPPYRVTADGDLAEWIWPGLAENHAHRHASHLYPLWYELDPAFDDPALRAAAGQTIERRLAWWRGNGDEMAFGLVQLGLAAAQLGLAEPAYETLARLTRYWRPSLVATHNLGAIFNVDICGGLPALVVAMLVRSGRDRVDLLPALPAAWPDGEVRGVATRAGVLVERLAWSPDELEAVLVPRRPTRLGLPDGTLRTVCEPTRLTVRR